MLPDLPRIVKKREADITPAVLTWFRKHVHASCALEVKATNKNSIPPSALAPHQKQALLQVKRGTLAYKIADTRRKLPFDAFMLHQAPAYVVACFGRRCQVIDVEKWRGARRDDGGSWIEV